MTAIICHYWIPSFPSVRVDYNPGGTDCKSLDCHSERSCAQRSRRIPFSERKSQVKGLSLPPIRPTLGQSNMLQHARHELARHLVRVDGLVVEGWDQRVDHRAGI